MELYTLLWLSAVFFSAAFIQGAVGMGFALIVAPFVSLAVPELIPVAIMISTIPLNLYVATREFGQLDKPGLGWITVGRVAGGLIGLAVLLRISVSTLNMLVGASTVLAALASLAAPAFTPGRKALMTAGLITGVTETTTGIGGPPLALVYQHQPGPVLRSTLAACFLLGQFICLAMLAAVDKITSGMVLDSLMLMPATMVGAFLSRFTHKRVKGKGLRAAVMIFAVAAGLFLLAREIWLPWRP